MASFKRSPRVREISATTGTGTYTLAGAPTGFLAFSDLGANNTCPYYATDGTDWEEGIGTVLTGPARLARTHVLRSSNSDAAVDWGAGNKTLRCGPSSVVDSPRVLSKSVAGGAGGTTLTADEQRRRVLVLTGVITGNRNVIVDETPWDWIVYNNTSGAFSITVKTSGGTGVVIPQGKRALITCDGTNVVFSADYLALAGGTMTGDLLFTDATYDIGKTGATRPRDLFLSRNATIGGALAMGGRITSAAGVTTGNNAMNVVTSGLGELEVVNNGTGAAIMAFHRSGAHALYFGLDTDNKLKIGGWSLGANAYHVLTSLDMLIWKGVVSSEQTITTSSLLTVAHGLSALPKIVRSVLRCKTAELGYAIGDEVDITSVGNHNSGWSANTAANATNLYWSLGASGPRVNNKSTFAESAITAGNWRLVFYAWG
jgi:hypothetical protein